MNPVFAVEMKRVGRETGRLPRATDSSRGKGIPDGANWTVDPVTKMPGTQGGPPTLRGDYNLLRGKLFRRC
eukprot:3517135-Pyramimonas_sp.AAC.1